MKRIGVRRRNDVEAEQFDFGRSLDAGRQNDPADSHLEAEAEEAKEDLPLRFFVHRLKPKD